MVSSWHIREKEEKKERKEGGGGGGGGGGRIVRNTKGREGPFYTNFEPQELSRSLSGLESRRQKKVASSQSPGLDVDLVPVSNKSPTT